MFHNQFDLFRIKPWINRERKDFGIGSVGIRILEMSCRLSRHLLPVRMEVERSIVHRRADPTLLEFFRNAITRPAGFEPARVKPNDVKVPGRVAAVIDNRTAKVFPETRELVMIFLRDPNPPFVIDISFREL